MTERQAISGLRFAELPPTDTHASTVAVGSKNSADRCLQLATDETASK
jgi:hypothetical protein